MDIIHQFMREMVGMLVIIGVKTKMSSSSIEETFISPWQKLIFWIKIKRNKTKVYPGRIIGIKI